MTLKIMNRVSEITKQVVATMSLEGMTLKKEEISLLRQCAEGKKSAQDAVEKLVKKYTVQK